MQSLPPDLTGSVSTLPRPASQDKDIIGHRITPFQACLIEASAVAVPSSRLFNRERDCSTVNSFDVALAAGAEMKVSAKYATRLLCARRFPFSLTWVLSGANGMHCTVPGGN